MDKYKNKKVAIIGFEINGKDALDYLLPKGADIVVFDEKELDELVLEGVDRSLVKFSTGSEYLKNGLTEFDYIFRSPAVYRFKPEIVDAEKHGVEVTSPIKLFFDLCPGKIIGVTGTKGKGTTCTLIYEILKKSNKEVYLAGNIGKPVLSLLPQLKEQSIVVLELSSFQLIDLEKPPHIAVVLNITSDHMDWHKDQEEYVKAKKNIVKHQTESDFAVINYDYKVSKSLENETQATKYYFSKNQAVTGCYVSENTIYLNWGDEVQEVIGVKDLILRGEHNWENVTAAILASSLVNADLESIRKAVLGFKGLEHRLEFVREVDRVKFYNDSFSTNIDTTVAAINAFKEDITLILGGFDKKLNYLELVERTFNASNLKNILLIGDIGEKYYQWYKNAGFKGNLVKLGYAEMEKIVQKARNVTSQEAVVLLSPSTSSFDMFDSYKKRGEEFKKAVNKL